MPDPERPNFLEPAIPLPLAAPVVEYASPSTPRRLSTIQAFPAEIWAAGLTVISAVLGAFANGVLRGAGLLFMPAVIAGVAWYVILRARRRKRTRLVWNVQLVLATLLCIAGTVGVVFETEGFPFLQWWNYGRARDWADFIFVGVGWFVVIEVAAWFDRRLTGYGFAAQACVPPPEPK